MNFLCKCGATFGINFISYIPECPRCGSGAPQLQMARNEDSDHHADRALRDLPVSETLLFLGALWLITNDFE